MSIRSCLRLAIAAILALLTCGTARTQSAVTGAVAGSVLDPSNAVIPSTTVTLRSIDTNKEDSVITGDDGRFRFSSLQPGTYSIRLSVPGFNVFNRDVIVEVGKVRTVDAALTLQAAASSSVDVFADAATVNTESKDFSTNIDQTAISELPINGRRWSNFVILTPGVVPDGSFGLLSFRGISGLMNNNTVDGGDNNQAFFGEERGRTRISYSVSQSAIREFQVNTSNYSAEYGRAAGGVTNAVTKSGTNSFHGDGFYFQRNNDWGARNPLSFQSVVRPEGIKRVGIKPEDVRHQFGGTIGGPIKKDKVFFFFSYDQQKRNFPGLSVFFSPSYLETVNVATGPGGLALPPRNLTEAQVVDALLFLNSLTGTVPRRGDQLLLLPKIDWQLNSKHTFTATYNRLRWNSPSGVQTGATVTRGRATYGDDFVKVDNGTARLLSTLSPTLLNEFRFQHSRDFEYQISQAPAPGEPRTSINGSAPDVFLTNGLEFGKPTFLERKKYPEEKRMQFTDSMTWISGSKTIKFGGDFNRVDDVLQNLFQESGAYSYSNINDFIIDYENWKSPLAPTVTCSTTARFAGKCYTNNYVQGFGPLGAQFKTTDYNFFLQLDWKPTPRLTINTGVRYEYQKLPAAQNPNTSSDTIPNTTLTVSQATSKLPNEKKDFGPRIGFALDATGDGKTAVRGGYGLYYGRLINSTIYNALVNTGASGGQTQVSLAATAAGAPVFPNVLASAPAGTGAIQFFSKDYNNPMIHQIDFIVERQVARNTTLSMSYLSSLGRRLPTFYDRNISPTTLTQTYTFSAGPFDGQTLTVPAYRGNRPNANFSQMTEIVSTVDSTYNAFVLQLNQRMSHGIQFQGSYTLSKATDTLQTSTTFTTGNRPYDVFNPRADRGRSTFDRRNKFVISTILAPRVHSENRALKALADGWSIAPIYQYYTGLPVDVGVSGSLPNGTGLSNATASGINGSGGRSALPNRPRNYFTGPGVWNVDMRVSRRFYLREGVDAEVLAEGFNIFNRTQITGINSTFYAISGTAQAAILTYQPAFLTVNETGGTLYRERQVQLGLRLRF